MRSKWASEEVDGYNKDDNEEWHEPHRGLGRYFRSSAPSASFRQLGALNCGTNPFAYVGRWSSGNRKARDRATPLAYPGVGMVSKWRSEGEMMDMDGEDEAEATMMVTHARETRLMDGDGRRMQRKNGFEKQ